MATTAAATRVSDEGPATPFAAVREAWLAPLILVGGAVNGLAVRGIDEIQAGVFSPTLGISPFQIIALLVAARLVATGSSLARPVPGWMGYVALLIILVPSSAVSWIAVALYAIAVATFSERERRSGALLFLALAASALWSSVVLKWIAAPVTATEAWLVGQAVGWLRPDIVQLGNLIGTPGVHNLILMTACTTADAVPVALVALAATALFLGRVNRKRLPWALAMLAGLYLVANVLRLGAMAWSGDMYALWHGPVGRSVFDVGQTVAVLGLGNWASRK